MSKFFLVSCMILTVFMLVSCDLNLPPYYGTWTETETGTGYKLTRAITLTETTFQRKDTKTFTADNSTIISGYMGNMTVSGTEMTWNYTYAWDPNANSYTIPYTATETVTWSVSGSTLTLTWPDNSTITYTK